MAPGLRPIRGAALLPDYAAPAQEVASAGGTRTPLMPLKLAPPEAASDEVSHRPTPFAPELARQGRLADLPGAEQRDDGVRLQQPAQPLDVGVSFHAKSAP